MGEHNITNESLAFSMVLVLIAIVVSYREKLGLEKDIVWSICRAVIQLIIVGYVLKYIFNVNHAVLTLLMVLFICFNAAWNAQKRSKYIDKAFVSSFIAITTGTALTLAVLVLSGSIEFTPMQVIPISGMIAGNAMVAVGLCYNNLGQRFSSEQQQLQEKLSLQRTAAAAGETKPGGNAKSGLGAADSREHSLIADPYGRFRQNGGAGEPAGHDVGADFCRYRSGKSD